MDDIINQAEVSQGVNEAGNINDYSVDVDTLYDSQVQSVEGEGTAETQQEIEIDERFADLDPVEARYRTYQSKYDKMVAEYNKLQNQYSTIEQKAAFVDKLLTDPDMLVAFINEVNPNLVQKPDTSNYIKSKLKEEFGENYRPTLSRTEAEIEDPGGTDWQYYKRLDELHAEVKSKFSQAKSLKEYKEQLAKKEQEALVQKQREIQKVQKEMNIDDNEIQAMLKFYSELDLTKAAKLWRLLRRQPQTKANLNLVSGYDPKGVSPQLQQFMNEFKLK